MVHERFDNLDAEKQERLFEAAADEFASHGFDGASLNRIIDRAGMSKGSLYYYFNDKNDLFATVIETYQQADGSIQVPDVLMPYFGGDLTISGSQ